MRKLLLAVSLLCSIVVTSHAQSAADRVQQREAEWKAYQLPSSNFSRQIAPEKEFIFRAPTDWKQLNKSLTFSGPNSSVIRVISEKVPDGFPLTDYIAGFMRAINSMSGNAEPPIVR